MTEIVKVELPDPCIFQSRIKNPPHALDRLCRFTLALWSQEDIFLLDPGQKVLLLNLQQEIDHVLIQEFDPSPVILFLFVKHKDAPTEIHLAPFEPENITRS